MTAIDAQPLKGTLVVELGRRLAVGAAGSLLAQLGAAVVLVEHTDRPDDGFEDKASHRDLLAVGKQSIVESGPDDADVQALLSAADVVLVSSDADAAHPPWRVSAHAVVCDITAFGASGALDGPQRGDVPSGAGRAAAGPVSDHLIQALSGIADTTGEPSGPPVAAGAPVVELLSALHAASAVVCALRVRRLAGRSQSIDIALYDCAVNTMTTFLPLHFGGGKPQRLGNAHALIAPWNAYRASDGWVLLCSGSNDHWQKICRVIGRPECSSDPRYAGLGDRVAHRDGVDAVVSEWTAKRPVATCVAEMSAAGLACGPIAEVAGLRHEPNLVHRRMVREVSAPDGRALLVPGNLFENARATRLPLASPAADSGRAGAETTARSPHRPAAATQRPLRLPLEGLRVVELGQYTTAPLVGRHLASLGAEVIKVEPPEGEVTRRWSPQRDGLSYFFVTSNAGKRSVGVDLREAGGRDFFRRLIASADVLVENMKPGSLARLGFPRAALAEINPRLVYAAISGFGALSAYPERPAFDTVVQAMSGLMDLTRSGATPMKVGISVADICAGQVGLLAVLAGLEQRDRTGSAPCYDLSMQDAAAWLTQLSWNGAAVKRGTIRPDGDGFLAVDRSGGTARVMTVAGVAEDARTTARGLIAVSQATDGWPLLRSPLRLSLTPPVVGHAVTGAPSPVPGALERELGLGG